MAIFGRGRRSTCLQFCCDLSPVGQRWSASRLTSSAVATTDPTCRRIAMASPSPLRNLAVIIRRLEEATLRMEELVEVDWAAATAPWELDQRADSRCVPASTPCATGTNNPLLRQNQADPTRPLAGPSSEPPSVLGFDEAIQPRMVSFVMLSRKVGGVVLDQSMQLAKTFYLQRELVWIASQRPKPPTASADTKDEWFMPLQQVIASIALARDETKPANLCLFALADAALCARWLVVGPDPAMILLRVLHVVEGYHAQLTGLPEMSDKSLTLWIEALSQLLNSLYGYVASFHPQGLLWAPSVKEEAFTSHSSTSGGGGSESPALCASPPEHAPAITTIHLPPGSDPVTKRLDPSCPAPSKQHRKVLLALPSTYKGKHRPPSPLPYSPTSLHVLKKRAAPTFRQERTQWIVSHQENTHNLVVEPTEPHQSVTLAHCTHCTVQIKGDISALHVTGCTRVAVMLPTLSGEAHLMRSTAVEIQVTNTASRFLLEGCDQVQLILPRQAAAAASVVKTKSSSINVLLVRSEGEAKELALPEQMKHTFHAGRLRTAVISHHG